MQDDTLYYDFLPHHICLINAAAFLKSRLYFCVKGLFSPPFLLFTPIWSKSSLLLRACTIIILLFQPFPFCMFWRGSPFPSSHIRLPSDIKPRESYLWSPHPPAWWSDITSLSYTSSLFHVSSYVPFPPLWVTSDITAFSSRSPLY